jgi:hypothetical protein
MTTFFESVPYFGANSLGISRIFRLDFADSYNLNLSVTANLKIVQKTKSRYFAKKKILFIKNEKKICAS